MVLASQQVNFNDVNTRLRMNPETTMKFEADDQVVLQNTQSEQSIRIKYDIMLILYEMVNWTTVGALCEGWPPSDQAKIKEYLGMMYRGKVIVVDESEILTTTPSDLPAGLGNAISINVENHHVMLRDSIRMASYRRAIEKAVTPQSVVMDIGAGTGILSFFAAKAGAQKVYAIEKRPDMAQLAEELSRNNQLDNTIEFICNSSHLIPSQDINPKPDIIVAEILGNAVLEESILEFTLDARERFLAPGGKLIPSGLEILAVPFDSGAGYDKGLEVTELEAMYGLKLELLKVVLAEKPFMKLERFNPMAYTVMGEPTSVIQLDFMTMTESLFSQPFTVKASQEGYINGFCVYFKAIMDGETILTNSPWAPSTHWTQVVFHFPVRKMVKQGETLAMEMKYDGGLQLWDTSEASSL